MKSIARSYRLSIIINAPLRFVYNWCTDYRDDDNKITGAKSRRIVLEKTKSRAIYVTLPKGAKVGISVSIITLHPPNGWHVNSIGDQRDLTGEYHLSRLGARSSKLDILFKHNWKAPPPIGTEFLRILNEIWAKYAAALERDYKSKKV